MRLDETKNEQIATGVPYATDEGMRMRGHAIHGGYFDVPLIQRVLKLEEYDGGGDLWQGGCINGLRLPEDFDYVLSLYPWGKYILGPNTERTEITMYDSLDQAADQAQELAASVVDWLRVGAKVLIHCQAGLNRSGLITAVTLVKLGYSPSDAIDMLRKMRCSEVLCNRSFEDYVRGLR